MSTSVARTIRRGLVVSLAFVAFALAALPSAKAQPAKKRWRIGLLGQGKDEPFVIDRLTKRLRELGTAAVEFEQRWSNDQVDVLPRLAAELVASKVDLLLVHGDSPAVRAAMSATRTIPIVFLWVGDPVGQGLVSSLSRPGGNVTGLSFFGPELELKRLEFLKQAVPTLKRVAVITNRTTPDLAEPLRRMQESSRLLGLELIVFDVRAKSDLGAVLAQIGRARVDGVIVQEEFLLDSLVEAADSALTAFALKQRLPLAAPGIPGAGRGVLLSYAFDWNAHFADAARLLDKLMKGAKPGEVPIVQSARFRLVLDLKTARAIGLELPDSLLLRADEVVR